jgi:[ribosomal protein S18]-alanine N-acetyltransferase
MTVSDLAAAAAIDRACFTGNEARTEAQLREELERTWARVRVARRGPDVLGYALFWHVADEVHLLNVAVAPAARRAGVGRALVEDIVAYARSHAAVKILLEVRASNAAAIALYEALGFERFNVRKRYYDDGEDGVEMVRRITA